MNPNILWGAIVFGIWATFSTWYYVNFIKDFSYSSPETVITTSNPTPEQSSTEDTNASNLVSDTLSSIPTIAEEPKPAPVDVRKSFLFHLNSENLISSSELTSFLAEVNGLSGQNLKVDVIGFACDLGSARYNLDLSKRRADEVVKYINQELKEVEDLNVNFYGESNPFLPNTSDANRKKNRRVTITIKSQP